MSTEPPIKVLDKAFAVVDLLAERPLTPGAIASALDEPRSTVYRLLRNLAKHGLVEEHGTQGAFRLGLRLFELGSAVSARFADIRGAALPVMTELNETTKQTVFLTTRKGLRAVCIERLDGQQVQVMILPRGGSVPLHGGSGARVLLAYAPDEVQAEFLERSDREQYTENTPGTGRLREELAAIRSRGYAIADDDVVPGIAAIGAPIFGHDGAIRAAISITGPVPSVLGDLERRNVDRVMQAAAVVSAAIGHDPAERLG